MSIRSCLPVLLCLTLVSCSSPGPSHSVPEETPSDQPPAWAADAIWYQIFVERFWNGDPQNDPTPADIAIPAIGHAAPTGWTITPWQEDWYRSDPWMQGPFRESLMDRRYGGDLQGVLDKLDYLQDLGINAIYFNPLNDAPSLHKYDAACYHHIDRHFGPDPEGDRIRIAEEVPTDPSTWQWTAADSLFLQVIDAIHQRGMKVIMDFSWNHTGTTFWAWQDILARQDQSPYGDWYEIESFDDPDTPENEFTYRGWIGVPTLPEIRKVDIASEKRRGFPYEGDLHPGMKAHILDVTRRWLAPDGDPTKGVDGFRLDVADEIGLIFWREFRSLVRSIKRDAYLVGEIWWQQWPDQLMDPSPYTRGDIFDAVMFYQVYRPARYFFARTDLPIDAAQLKDSLELQWSRLRPETRTAMMLTASSHDTPRLLSSFGNPNKYKANANPYENPAYQNGSPDKETIQRLNLYLLFQFTISGAPHIWNGEEMGMWGGDDPDCRKPLMWQEITFPPESDPNHPERQYERHFDPDRYAWYQSLTRLRRDHPVLRQGDMAFIHAEQGQLAYLRQQGTERVLVCFNMDDHEADFALPDGSWTDLLRGGEPLRNQVTLASLEGRIFQRTGR